MDQSKAETQEFSDQTIRLTCLQLAIQTNAHPNGEPSAVAFDAQDFYDFLKGENPYDKHPEEAEPEEPKGVVTDFTKFRSEQNRIQAQAMEANTMGRINGQMQLTHDPAPGFFVGTHTILTEDDLSGLGEADV